MDKLKSLKTWFINTSLPVKLILLVAVLGIGYFVNQRITASKTSAPQYTTATAQKGTLVTSITASGNISGGNNTTIYTAASGQVTKVYVKNGDKVTQGQKLADIKLDQDAQSKQTSAWAAYLTSKNNYQNAVINKASLVSSVDSANKTVMDAQNAVNAMNNNITNGVGNPSTHQSYTDLEKNSITSTLTVAQENYNIANQKLAMADQNIAQAQASQTSSWYTYQQSSPTITAPASGVLTNFALTPGISLGNLSTNTSSNSNSNANTTQSVGVISNPNNQITAVVNLTEMDVVKAAPGQKTTLTMDAFPDKTFTGKILSINTNGQMSSGVNTYPTTIIFDTGLPTMYPNMAVNATIITNVKDNVVTVPTAAVQTSNGTSTVRVLKDGKVSVVTVTTGDSNDTDTEIVSGVSVGDVVVTGTSSTSTQRSGSSSGRSTSPFSTFGGAGGGNVRFRAN